MVKPVHFPVLAFCFILVFSPIKDIFVNMNRLLELIKNKYFLSVIAFVVWMLFFDRNDFLAQYEFRSEVSKLQEEKDFYVKEIAQVKNDLNELSTNLNTAEKFAREKYFMKKDNEDVFVIIHEAKKD
ncbi:cell division protein FtsB [Pedobacter sp. UYP24]